MAESGYRAAVPVNGKAIDRGALQQERHDVGFVKNARDQLAIFQVIGGQRRFIFGEAAVDLVHPVPRVVDGFALAEQLL